MTAQVVFTEPPHGALSPSGQVSSCLTGKPLPRFATWQRFFFAGAAALALSLPAHAQLKVYGAVDMGYQWSGKNVDSSTGSRVGLDSGLFDDSFIGFEGSEDLGNGLTLGFVLERSLSVDTGEDGDGFDRQAFLFIEGDYGSFSFGRQYSPEDDVLSSFDPFEGGLAGAFGNVWKYDDKLDNYVLYASPEWGGFSFSAGWTFNADGDESLGNKVDDVRVATITPQYVSPSGDFAVALHVSRATRKTRGNPENGDKIWIYDLFGSYDFGPVKLSAGYGIRNASNDDFMQYEGEGEDTRQWAVGASFPIGDNGTLLATYARRKTDVLNSSDTAKVSQWGIGYFHNLSKRTMLYTSYGRIRNNGVAKNSVSLLSDIDGRDEGYQRGFNIGIRHAF